MIKPKRIDKMSANNKQVKLVIDGMTGVGKSSLVEIAAKVLKLVPYEEIFEDKHRLLYKFFEDRERWAFPMQLNFLNNRFQQFKEASSISNVVMDRSIFSDDIFARMYRHLGYLCAEEYDIYQGLRESMMDNISPPQLMVFLKVDTDVAIRRIHERNRPEEMTVEKSYWARLNEYYNEHYARYNNGELLTLDVSKLDFVHNEGDRHLLLEKIKDALARRSIPNTEQLQNINAKDKNNEGT